MDKWRKETPYVTPVTMDIGYAMRNHILEEPFDIIKFLGWVTELKSMNVDTLIVFRLASNPIMNTCSVLFRKQWFKGYV